jgi:hypothetical protein
VFAACCVLAVYEYCFVEYSDARVSWSFDFAAFSGVYRGNDLQNRAKPLATVCATKQSIAVYIKQKGDTHEQRVHLPIAMSNPSLKK